MPSASGSYIIKGIWSGDDAYSGIGTTVNFSVAPMATETQTTTDEKVFSVSSNSTLSALTFNSAQKEISFTVSGDTGTYGFVQICIPKTIMPVVANLKVNLDGQTVPHSVVSEADVWIIILTYHHSTHTVTMNIDPESSLTQMLSLSFVEILLLVVIVLLVVTTVCITLLLKQKRRAKNP
ncbi:MAG: hypothetical protein LBQ98_00090 [Nitrososphaerota archaeon]|jgi:hypothetical protein|nr:hypothetical protein [Nitrososphaerota archaeon]